MPPGRQAPRTRPGAEPRKTKPVTPAPMLGLRRFWRIPVALLVGALLGFGFSYLFGVTYEANAKLLNRVNNVTFLGSNGSTLSQQGAVVEQSGVSKIVADTESALLENRSIATEIVRELDLDERADEGGWFQAVKRGFATVLKGTYSYVVHGEYVKLNDFDQAVVDTEDGLGAKQVGFSYVIEVTGRWETPEEAEAITNLAADQLVALAEEQFLADVNANIENLAAQLELAGAEQQRTAAELATFADRNGIEIPALGDTLTPDLTLELSPPLQSTYRRLLEAYNTALTTYGQLQNQYQQAKVYAGVEPVQLTRLDEAVPSVYPVSPKRWLYMGIGIVLGALIGLGLTARDFWRRGETLFPRDDDLPRRPTRIAVARVPTGTTTASPEAEAPADTSETASEEMGSPVESAIGTRTPTRVEG